MAVLINKAMIEIPPKFAGKPPVNPDAGHELARGGHWNGKGAQGLAEDVRYYGQWMRDEAEKRIGHLYPKVEVTAEMAKERPDLKPLRRPEADGDRLALGAHGEKPEPGVLRMWMCRSPRPSCCPPRQGRRRTSSPCLRMSGPPQWTSRQAEAISSAAHSSWRGSGYRFTVKVGKPKDAEAAKNGPSWREGRISGA